MSKSEVQSLTGSMKSKTIPLSALILSKKNGRRKAPSQQSIVSLAASILANGLINDLIVTDAGNGKFAVEAGGRRLRALHLLRKSKKISSDEPVRCKIIPKSNATQTGLTENFHVEHMHFADQISAFKALADDESLAPMEIAARFGVAESTVRQALRLAGVAPEFIDLYRDDKATYEQLVALAICDDHDKQRQVWEALKFDYNRTAQQIRALLVGTEIKLSADRLAQFVGIAAYESAGGGIRRDLFSDDVYLADRALVEALAVEKLEKQAAPLRAEQWAWVKVEPRCDYLMQRSYRKVPPQLRDLPPKEQKRLDKLNRQLEKLGDQIDEGTDAESAETLENQYEKIESDIEQIHRAREWYDDETRNASGVLIYVGDDGDVVIAYGLQEVSQNAPASKGKSQTAPKPKGSVSAKLARELSIERTFALQAVLADNPTMALAATVHALLIKRFFPAAGKSCLDISISRPTRIESADREALAVQAKLSLATTEKNLVDRLPADESALWDWIVSQNQDELLKILAICVAAGLNGIVPVDNALRTESGADVTSIDLVARAVELDMASWWTPTGKNYLAGVSKQTLAEAISEAHGDMAAAGILAKKKGEAIAAAEHLLSNTRWLPRQLRTR